MHISPALPRNEAKIESTASGVVGDASSAPDALSTRQLGVKHSITKRFTQRRCWEVRMPSLPRRRRVQRTTGGLQLSAPFG
ncbi:hypothetical protein, partial [Streptomyces cacaoi]|uniref:hypothetical protein n=1 Tax=Streptomyces cacaoi TaxID=1898 RepID=UPI0037485B7F